jgi:hypothetical protein
MLEHINYSIIRIENIEDLFTAIYVIVDDIYHHVTPAHIKYRRNAKTSIMRDSEIITISIVGELMTIDSQTAWFNFCKKNFTHLFKQFCDRTRFNRIHRALSSVIKLILNKLNEIMHCHSTIEKIVDSMPIYACHFGRAYFHKTYKGFASYGRCASKKQTFYGFRLHIMVELSGYVSNFVITSANVDDRVALWDLTDNIAGLTILGDKGYTGKKTVEAFKQEKKITLIPLKRKLSKDNYPEKMRQLIFKARRRIETTGSQLSQQLNIQKILSRSIHGMGTRVLTKILGYNISQYLNKLLGLDVAKIKHLVF